MPLPVGRGGIDYPDFGMSIQPHENPVNINLAEQTIRLGYPGVFEKTGNLLLLDQFEYGLGPWGIIKLGDGNNPHIDATYYRRKAYSVKLSTGVGANANSGITQYTRFPYPASFGVEFSFLTRNVFEELSLVVQFADSTEMWQAGIKIYDDATTLKYLKFGGGEETIATHDLEIHGYAGWHTVKMVLDYGNQEYERLMVDTQDYSLAGIACPELVFMYADILRVTITLTGQLGRAERVWIDDVIITLNEPSY